MHGVHSAPSPDGSRCVSSHDDDILDFDFFEDDATREAQAAGRPAAPPVRREEEVAGRAGRSCGLRTGVTPILRLIGLVAFAILVVVLLVVWGAGLLQRPEAERLLGLRWPTSGRSGRARPRSVPTWRAPHDAGAEAGRARDPARGADPAAATGRRSAPKHSTCPARCARHTHAIEALQLRVGGMQGLLDTFMATKDDDSKNATAAGEKLASRHGGWTRATSSGRYLFRVPAQATLQDEGWPTSTAPASVFVENAELYTARSMTAIWLRIHGASTGGTPVGRPRDDAREGRRAAGGRRSSRPTPRRRSRPRPISPSTSR